MMHFQDGSPVRVRFPRGAVVQGLDAHGFSRARRRRARDLRGVAALRALGVQVAPEVVDAAGAPVTDAQASAVVAEVEADLRALSSGPAAHAQETVSSVAAEARRDDDEVSRTLDEVYRRHDDGRPAEEVLRAFHERVKPWLSSLGVRRVDHLFDVIDLARAPESLGVLLLAITRLTRQHFARRNDFVVRFASFLTGRGGRTAAQVEAVLRGLRA